MNQLQNLEGGVMQSIITPSQEERGAFYNYHIAPIAVNSQSVEIEPIDIKFQCGNPANGVNGLRDEDFISMLIHRAARYHDAFPTEDNKLKLEALNTALYYCNKRAKERISAGIQGKIEEPEIKA